MFIKSSIKIKICFLTALTFFSLNSFGQDSKLMLKEAKTLFEANNFEQAIAKLNPLIAAQPSNEEALTMRTRAFIILNKMPEAAADADKVLTINPKNLFALNVRGMVKRANKDYNGAMADFTQIITIDPNFYRAYANRARTKANLKYSLSEVLADYDAYFKLNEDIGLLREAGDYCLIHKGAPETCASYFAKYKQKVPDSFHGYLGYALSYANPYSSVTDKSIFEREIIPNFKKAIELNPNDATAPRNLGRIYANLEKHQDALIWLNKAAVLDPKNADVFGLLCYTYGRTNDAERAISNCDKALELNPKYENAIRWRNNIRAAMEKRAANPSNNSSVALTVEDARIALLALTKKETEWHEKTGAFVERYQKSFLDRVGGLTPAERTELAGFKKEGEALIADLKNYQNQFQIVLQSSDKGKQYQNFSETSVKSINEMLGFINGRLKP